jgi:ATP-dependent helicase/nuclease subunit B
VTGLGEGMWPHRPGDDPLLPDRIRSIFGVPPRGVPVAEQRRRFLDALATGRYERVVSYPAADLRSGRGFEPSRWLLDPYGEGEGEGDGEGAAATPDVDAGPRVPIERIESFAAGLRSSAPPAGAADLDVRLLAAWRDQGRPLADSPVVHARPQLATGLETIAQRGRPAFTRFDGNVADGIAASHLDERLLSPTSLERYAACPFRYFLTNVLRVGAVERPEELETITGIHAGSLVHEVLERFVVEVLERPVAEQPAPDTPWDASAHARLDELFDDVAARFEREGRTGRWLRWQHDKARLRNLLHAFLRRDDEYRRQHRATPAAAEMTFGNESEAPVEVRVGERVLRFHGQADRVDRTEAGGLVVLDYKASKPDYYRPLVEGDPVQRGQRLQLPIYALAARQHLGVDAPARAGYVFIHETGPVEPVGYEVDGRRMARFEEVVGLLAEGITSGQFPLRPGVYDSFWGTHDNCRFCDYDRLCPSTRGEQWDGVVDAPELARYVDLVEGPDPWDVDEGADAADAPASVEGGGR